MSEFNAVQEAVFLGTYFTVYEILRFNPAIGALVSPDYLVPLSGGIAGASAWGLSLPLDTVKQNIQGRDQSLKKESSTFETSRTLWQQSGLRGLYRGVGPSLTRAFVVSGARWTAYEEALKALKASSASSV